MSSGTGWIVDDRLKIFIVIVCNVERGACAGVSGFSNRSIPQKSSLDAVPIESITYFLNGSVGRYVGDSSVCCLYISRLMRNGSDGVDRGYGDVGGSAESWETGLSGAAVYETLGSAV